MKCIRFIVALFLFCLNIAFAQKDAQGVKIEINASKIAIFDAASQILIERNFTLLTTNERIGLITTDYTKADESFGSSLLLSLFGREDMEVMITTNIAGSGNRNILSIFPKARVKKQSRIKLEYEEISLSKRSIEGFRTLGENIKALAEQTDPSVETITKQIITKETPSATPKTEVQPTTIAATSQERNISYLRIRVNTANIRNAPSLQGSVIGSAKKGEEYKIIGLDASWYEIIFNENDTGYVNKDVCVQFDKKEVPAIPQDKPVANASSTQNIEYIEQKGKSLSFPSLPAGVSQVNSESSPSNNIFSEKDYIFSLGIGVSLMMGDMNDVLPFGFGIDFYSLIKVFDKLYVSGSLSSYYFPGNDNYWEYSMLRIQPMLGIQYRYPIQSNMTIYGGVGVGSAIDILSYEYWGNRYSDTHVAVAVDIVAGIKLSAFSINPRIRITGHGGTSYSSFDFAVGYVF